MYTHIYIHKKYVFMYVCMYICMIPLGPFSFFPKQADPTEIFGYVLISVLGGSIPGPSDTAAASSTG